MKIRSNEKEDGSVYLELHCVHNDGPLFVDPTLIGAIRKVTDPKLGTYTRLHMNGMADIEIREPYEDIVQEIWS